MEIFRRQPYTLKPVEQMAHLSEEAGLLEESLPDINCPNSLEEVYLGELKRRMKNVYIDLSSSLSTEMLPWQEVVEAYGIPQEDLNGIEKWLNVNLDAVVEANNRLFENSEELLDRRDVHMGDANLRERSEGAVSQSISSIKQFLIDNFGDEAGVSEMLAKYDFVIDSWTNRSYFNWITMSISAVKRGRPQTKIAIPPVTKYGISRRLRIFATPAKSCLGSICSII